MALNAYQAGISRDSYAETTTPQRLREKLDEQFILNETAVEQLG